MAVSQGDGSIVLTTKVDTKGVEKGFSAISSGAQKLSDGVKKVGATVGKAFLAAGAAATTAAVAITKAAVDAYADYEQLVGGVETLFKGSSKKLIEYANEAYRTSGVSANEYMQNVTSFSASLLSAVGGDTEKAADIANAAMISISDNVNKMGSSVESVQMAFQGFAKQQYQLLDNLKLGYGGTKGEMERLLKDAQAITGVKYNIDNLADVYTAIGVIQEKLGIAGTTAKEAATTISGSAATMKAAWQNVLVAIVGGGDLNRAIANLVDSISIYFQNIVPVVERALAGIGVLIQQVAPMLVQTVARSLIAAIPNLLSAVYNMIIGIAKGIYQGIVDLFSGKTTQAFSAPSESINTNTSAQQSFTSAVYESVDAVEELAVADEENLDTVAEQAESVETTNSNQEDLTESVKETNKELKKSLAGFDDIQTLSSGMSEDMEDVGDSISDSFAPIETIEPVEMEELSFDTPSLDMGGGGGAEQMMAETPAFLTNIYNEVQKIFDLFSQGFWQGFGEADFSKPLASLQGISQQLSLIATDVAPHAQSAANAFVFAFGQITGSFASIGTTIATNVLGGIELYLTENSPYITERIAGIFDASGQIATHVGNLWSAFAYIFSAFSEPEGVQLTGHIVSIFSNAFLGVTELSTKFGRDFIGLISTPINDNKEELRLVLQDVLGFFNEIFAPIDKLVTETGEKFNKLYDEHVAPTFESITKVISGWVKTFTDAYNKYIKPVLDRFAEKFTEVVEEHVTPMIDKVINWLEKVMEYVRLVWENVLKPVVDWVIKILVRDFAYSFAFIGDIFNTLLAVVSDVIGAIMDTMAGVLDFVIGTFTGDWERAWGGLKDIFAGIINGIIAIFEGCINLIIDGLNAIIRPAGDIAGAIGDLIGLDWDIPEIPSLSLPRLAQGAVIPANREFLAVLGDQRQGTNIETPLTTMIEAFQAALDSRGGYSNGNIEVVLELDGREFGRAVVEQGNRENRRIGTRLVVI